MPGNLLDTVGTEDKTSVVGLGELAIARGRKRYCKKCKFTCTDAREFTTHRAKHTESDDDKLDIATSVLHISTVTNTGFPRAFKRKLSSKGKLSNIARIMELNKNSVQDTVSTAVDNKPMNTDEILTDIHSNSNSEQHEGEIISCHSNNSKHIVSKNEESDETEEKGDEPDAMVTVSSHESVNNCRNISDDRSVLPSDVVECFSGGEDDDGSLAIDDNISNVTVSFGSVTCRNYTCRQCEMTTTSAKFYLSHLNSDHGMDINIFECKQCEYATVYKHQLIKHKKLHVVAKENCLSLAAASCSQPPLTSTSFSEQDSYMLEDIDDMEEDGSSSPPEDQIFSPTRLTVTADNIDKALDDDRRKKKKTRQEVDPAKYFEVVDGTGTKYACSQCGNIYKWRKSLNKHWKEKHSSEPLVEDANPPGMAELLKSGKYTKMGRRRIYDNVFLDTIRSDKQDSLCAATSHNSFTRSPSPPNFLGKPRSLSVTDSNVTTPNAPQNHKMVGSFISHTAQPVFPGMSMNVPHLSLRNDGYDSTDDCARDPSHDSWSDTGNSPHSSSLAIQNHNSSLDQDQPLDFSKNSKSDEIWKDVSFTKTAHSISQRQQQNSKSDVKIPSEGELINHTSYHLSKRIVKCFDCKIQCNSMDQLNNHFIKLHFQKLSEYKEAVKKIPHGLQQTYHLLNMEIHDIGELSSQDLGAPEGKSLKCRKCDFEAKWPAELQKHAVSHSEERPYVCMICGSTYKWKWDLVKHFQKSHPNLPNPYKRNDKKDTPAESSEDEEEPTMKRHKFDDDIREEEPTMKRHKFDDNARLNILLSSDGAVSVEEIFSATQAGQTAISKQPNFLNDEPPMERSLALSGTSTNIDQTACEPQSSKYLDRSQGSSRISQHSDSSSSNISNSGTKMPVTCESTTCSPRSGCPIHYPYRCPLCDCRARWPSEITQHLKNHSNSKPYLCPRCQYKSKWKWDVVKHLKRCGGGGIKDVIDTTKPIKCDGSMFSYSKYSFFKRRKVKGKVNKQSHTYLHPSVGESNQQSSTGCAASSPSNVELAQTESNASIQENAHITNNNDECVTDNNINNNYTAYTNGLPCSSVNQITPTLNQVHSSLENIQPKSSSPAPSLKAQSGNWRQSSGEVWNCPHCPFTTQSQTELKRHSDIHSDDKPFKCCVCQYSTRWACDLKKHRKSYNHFPKTNSYKVEKFHPRFKCSQCVIYFETLANLVEHRLSEHVQNSSQNSPSALAENDIDMARIKHPRKQVRQFQCPKCPFICKSRHTIEGHMRDHEQLEMGGINCFYCNSLFKDKESLLDHICTHSAFKSHEWETYFMLTDEEQQQPKVAQKSNYEKDVEKQKHEKKENGHNKDHVKDGENGKVVSTNVRIHQILNEIPKQGLASQKTLHMNKFKCEWCPAEFGNLTLAYKHAWQTHPTQLREQTISSAEIDNIDFDNLSSKHLSSVKLSPSNHQLSAKTSHNKEAIDILKQQIEGKRNHNVLEKYADRVSHNVLENLKTDDGENSTLYACDICSFSSRNPSTFRSHELLHNCKLTSQCWFCDYSVEHMNLLYQHMKISHARNWKMLSLDPKYSAYIRRISMSGTSDHSNSSDCSSDIIDLSSKMLSQAETAYGIIYLTKLQYTWSGIPVNIIPVDNTLKFACPYCPFYHVDVAETCRHVMQTHTAVSKFTCKTCGYSDDSIQNMSDHCRKEHPKTEKMVEVLEFKQINFSELQNVQQLNALRQIDHIKQETKLNVKPVNSMCCPFCPFKTWLTEHMKEHVLDHSKQAKYQCQMCDFASDSATVISEHAKVHDTSYAVDGRSVNETKVSIKKECTDRKMDEPESKIIARVHPIMGPVELDNACREEFHKSKVTKRVRYRCFICPYHTTCKSNVMKHRRQHNNFKKYKCPKCSYGAARAVLLKKHIDSHEIPVKGEGHDIFFDPNNPDNNVENEESGDTEMEEDDNMDSDLDERDAKAIADFKAKNIPEAKEAHKVNNSLEDVDEIDKQFCKKKCPHCPFSSISGSELRKHLYFHCTQDRYKCDLCSYSLDRLNLLSQHRRLHAEEPGFVYNPPTTHLLNTGFILKNNAETEDLREPSLEEQTNETAGNQFFCRSCPYKTTKKKSFDIHNNNHNSRKCYICDFCDWSIDRIELLYQHRRVHENESGYNPTSDDKNFLNQEFGDGSSGEFEAKLMEVKSLEKPLNEDQSDKPLSPPFKLTVVKKSYLCETCPYKTNSRDSSSFHKSMHDSGSKFACNKCSYASGNKGLLQQHAHIHSAGYGHTTSHSLSTLKGLPSKRKLVKVARLDKDVCLLNSMKYTQDNLIQLDSPISSELKCPRCPFTASSHQILIDHTKGHLKQESFKCPYCDFTSTSRHIILPHVQIHFPGTKLELEALELILENHSKTINNNVSSSKSSIIQPDSLITDKTLSTIENIGTVQAKKIYVCQFCEREFAEKLVMIQHEKQHLVGNH